MPINFGHKLSADRGAKILEQLRPLMLPGEEVFLLVKCNNMRPMTDHLFVSNFRLAGKGMNGISVQFLHNEAIQFAPDQVKETFQVTTSSGQMLFKMVQREDHDLLVRTLQWARGNTPVEDVAAAASTPQAVETSRLQRAKQKHWPDTQVIGSRLTSKASQAVERLCHGNEDPWLILVSFGGAGVLAAWQDRLAIIKTGAITSFMAGSLGGERSATFHFRDVTGVEYNSGFVNGVLEILTPSYAGTANRDFWRGTTKSRNADSNDPWTLSNCLPLAKQEYNAALPQLSELRRLVSQAKSPVVQVTVANEAAHVDPANGLAAELKQLAELHSAGVLNEAEFEAAKQRVLHGA